MARQEIASTIDTLRIAVHKNHANYLAGRPCWSYEYRIVINERTKICGRQRQHIQEIYGRMNRQLKHLTHVEREATFQAHTERQDHDVSFYARFYRLATQPLPQKRRLLTQAARNMEESHGT
jgi:hypothetical protein